MARSAAALRPYLRTMAGDDQPANAMRSLSLPPTAIHSWEKVCRNRWGRSPLIPATAPRRRSICATPEPESLPFGPSQRAGKSARAWLQRAASVSVEGDHGGVADGDGAGAGLASDPSDSAGVVDVLDVHVDQLAEPDAGVGEQEHDGGVASFGEAAAFAHVDQGASLVGAEDRRRVVGHLRMGHPSERVAVDLFFGVQPAEQHAEVSVVHAECRRRDLFVEVGEVDLECAPVDLVDTASNASRPRASDQSARPRCDTGSACVRCDVAPAVRYRSCPTGRKA